VLLLGKKLTAAEALKCGFVTEVFPAATFQEETKHKLEQIPKLLPNSLKESKKLVRSLDQAKLHKVNDLECQKLVSMWQGEECLTAAAKFLSRK
jgi:Delta3-Delta2-enoyl-CoA isomerase